MNLSQEQLQKVGEWVAQGADIAEVQKNISSLFGVNMTYMDVRFLIDDIGASLKDKPSSLDPKPEAAVDAAEVPQGQETSPEPEIPAPEQPQSQAEQAGAGSVKVSVSPIQRPGMLAGGDVVFSDGQSAQWFVDQMGRLSLSPATQGYKPSEADIAEFQMQLQALFR